MKDKIVLLIKGFFLGIANIIPGVSGGTLAITMGIYEELIDVISHFFKDIKKSINLLLPIILGAGLSILLLSKIISKCLDRYPFPTMLFFVGLIIGGIPLIARKVRGEKKKPVNIIVFLITFALIITMAFLNSGSYAVSFNNLNIMFCLIIFVVGIVAAATMVIPGVSGSFVLMLLGFYKPIVKTISNLTDFSMLGKNLMILVPFGIGVVVGIILVAKLIEFLLKKYEVTTYYGILGFVFSSVLTLLYSAVTSGGIGAPQICFGILLLAIGSVMGYLLGDV